MGQFEWESSNLHVAYPFEQPGVPGLNDAFADAVVMDTAQGQRVRLAALTISAWNAGGVSANIQYEDGSPFFASTPDIQVDLYGDWVIVLFSKLNKEVQLIMSASHALPIIVNSPVRFVTRVQECDPKAVNSIEVTDGITNITHILAGDIELCAGYNVELAPYAKDVSFRPGGVGVSLGAIPGAGLGVSPSDCAPAGVLRSINTVGPDDKGHFKFTALDCYRCYIPCATPSPQPSDFDPLVASVQLANDCVQCCKCKDYENVYKAMARLHDNGRNTGMRMARTIDDFNDLKKEVNHQKDMREIPTMDLLLMPSPGYFMGVQVLLLNNPTFPELDMDQDDRDFALLRMLVTSEASMSSAVIIPTAMYLYNSRYGNPWIRVTDKATLFTPTPVDFTDEDGIGLIVKMDVVPSKFYNIIRSTEYIALSFQIAWKSEADPQDGQLVTVTLESDIFKPYTLTKIEKLMEPLDVDGITP